MLPINEIIEGDCLDILRSFPDKSIDLVLTDPPYGIGASNKSFKSGSLTIQRPDDFYGEWDNAKPSKEIFDEIFRVSKNQIIWGGNYFIDCLYPTRCMIFWDKHTQNTSYADGELAWTSFDRNMKLYNKSWVGANAKDGERVHPTQKSIDVMLAIIKDFSIPTDLILDPFAGSGTTCVAAKMEGRNYIGIEISEKYCKIARERLKSVTQKLL
jgi:site-specific DNA-methyltransferase (adenine-specific)